jgi:hypothetical protein
MIPPAGFSVITQPFRRSAFRLETLQDYSGSGEDPHLAAFLAGKPRPPSPEHEQWAGAVRAHRRAGRVLQRVHVVTEPLSDYIRWELSWGYQPGVAAGEEVCIIPVADGEWPVEVPHRDFWLFDDTELYDMHYTLDGTWLGAEPVTDSSRIEQARAWRDTALQRALPWQRYIRSHPELAARVSTELLVS